MNEDSEYVLELLRERRDILDNAMEWLEDHEGVFPDDVHGRIWWERSMAENRAELGRCNAEIARRVGRAGR